MAAKADPKGLEAAAIAVDASRRGGEPVLRIENLSFAYPGQAALVSHWSATVTAGVTLLWGDTGSGKSTVLRLLAGTAPIDGGLTLGGIHCGSDPQAYRHAVFWREPGTDAFDRLSPRQIVASLRAERTQFDGAAWDRHATGFALTEHIDKPLYMLSTGSKRKVWLAAALAARDPLTLLDDPFAALDGPSIGHLRRALVDASTRHDRAIIVATAGLLDGVPLAGRFDLPLG